MTGVGRKKRLFSVNVKEERGCRGDFFSVKDEDEAWDILLSHIFDVYLPPMIVIEPQEGENLEKMLRRYKRKFDRLGIAREVRNRMHFIPKSVQRREQVKRAAYRQRIQQQLQQG